VIKARFGENLDGRIQRLFPFLFRRAIDPNLLTAAGLLVSLAAAAAFAQGAFRLAAMLVLIGGFFDLVDGVVARHHGLVSTFGAFLDSSLDRVVDMALLLGIQMHYARSGAPALAWLAGLALVGCVMVSYTKARAESVLPGFKGGLMERAERILVLVAGALFGLMPLALVIVAVGAGVTAVQRMVLAYRGMAALDRERSRAAPAEGG
jgi:CDP-diacylglycerol--glycerol-3-phosphate 3-phosphatidyltransferase